MIINNEIKAGLLIALIIILMTLISFVWVPYEYNKMDSEIRLMAPNIKHLLGTDNFGRDIFSRIMAGGRNTLLLAICTVAASSAIGCFLGLLSGYLGGITGDIIMRIIDTLNSFPGIVLALFIVAVLDNSQYSIFFALIVLFIPSFTRVMRTGALKFKTAEFIQAEKMMGAGFLRIIFIHILPNAAPSLLCACAIGLSNAILAESVMSYLGMGIQPPHPSWGRMLFESQSWFFNAPWYALAPGFFIMMTVIAFNLLGNGLRRSLGGRFDSIT